MNGPHAFSVSFFNILVLTAVGTLNILALLFYLLALHDDEASIVIVFYQFVPVFAYALGFAILGESLTTFQLIAMAIIILAIGIFSPSFSLKLPSKKSVQSTSLKNSLPSVSPKQELTSSLFRRRSSA